MCSYRRGKELQNNDGDKLGRCREPLNQETRTEAYEQ
jgi:hypothetical protein